MARESDWTQVYQDVEKDGAGLKVVWYVRLTPIETSHFRHGISLGTSFATRRAAEAFADLVDDYMDDAVIASNERRYDPPGGDA